MTTEDRLRSLRREPPPFRKVAVERTEWLTPRMARLTFSGPELEGLVVEEPAASVRLLIPTPGEADLAIPDWTGNEFLLSDTRRPTIRTLTPVRVDPGSLEVDLDVVVAHSGALADWASAAVRGDPAAISGPGRGYDVDSDATTYVLAGDETAIPAITQLIPLLPPEAEAMVLVEIGAPQARVDFPSHPRLSVDWLLAEPGERPGQKLAASVEALDLAADTRLWAAGEAAAMQRIRKHLFQGLGLPRSSATVRGYWKWGRAAPS